MFQRLSSACPPPAPKVPAGPEWLHEIKYDGFRLGVEREGNRVRLITRGGYDWTKRYPWILEAAPRRHEVSVAAASTHDHRRHRSICGGERQPRVLPQQAARSDVP
jgi:ATP-dependent DNA ligase